MRTYCVPSANTIGSGYLAALSSTGVFTNPIQIDQSNPLTIAYFYFFQYVDAVEQLMLVLNTNTLDTIDMTAFGQQYLGYLGSTTLTIAFLTAMAEQNATTPGAVASPFVTLAEDLQLDALISELDVLTSICIDERLQVLKDEYTRRLTQYQQQHTFLNYYKNHPGLEHKAGVPKGGTLVLVYHTAPATTPTAPTGPILTGPILTGPILTGPILTNPVLTNPVATNPVATNPVLTNPVLTNPVVTNPVLTNPVTTNPVLTNPVVTNPVSTNPVLTNPVTTNPVTTNPVLTNPVTTNPVLTNPVTTTPVLTNPVLTNPVLTNPVTAPVKAAPVLNNPVLTHRALAGQTLSTTITANPVLTSTILNHPIATANPVVSSAPTLDANTLNLLRTYVTNLQDTSDQKQLLINLLANQPVAVAQPQYQLDDGAVIADFYIPYLCCSDCPPMAYIGPPAPVEPPPVTDKPTFQMATTFCDNDTKPSPITVSAPGGTFNTVKGLDGVKLAFVPATAGAGTYNIVYTLNGVDSDPTVVTVLPTPVSTFTFKSVAAPAAFQATFTPDSQDKSFTYQWTFGPGFKPQTSTDAVPVVTVQIDPTGAQTATFATLLVSNGNCSIGKPVNVVLAISPNGVFIPAAGPQKTIKSNVTKAPVTAASAKATPAKAAPAKASPVKETPAKKAPIKSASAKAVPAKVAPAKKAPAKAAPVKKAAPKKKK